MTNDVVRQFRTVIRYDRFQYQTTVQTWTSNGTYESGTLVRYDDRVWSATPQDSAAVIGPTFELENWTEVNAATYTYPGAIYPTGLTGVDRTMGLYVPGVNEPGLDLPLLVDGIAYPGVQVWGDYFAGNLTLDANYQSEFADIYLGERFIDINVDGGEFIGPYEGHAPEELVNAAEYDTMDMRIYTRPGSDWTFDGHGFQIGTQRYTYAPTVTNTLSWAGIVEHPFNIVVSNLTTGLVLNQNIDYTANWADQTVTILAKVSAGNLVNIDVYEVGGGSQLYRMNYTGAEIESSTVIVPVNYAQLVDVYVFINGSLAATPDLMPYTPSIPYDVNLEYYSLDIVFNDNEISITGTNGVSNYVTCSNTSALTVGQPIVFAGTGFGGIVAGQTYYIQEIASRIQFSISSTAGTTSPDSLSTASGNMTAAPQGTYYRAIQTVIPGISLSNTNYWLPFVPTQRTKVTITDSFTNTDGLAVLVMGDANSVTVTNTTVAGNSIVLLGSVSSLSVGQAVTFSGYSLGGIETNVDYQILSINNTTSSITITENGTTAVALIDDRAVWSGELTAKFVPTDYRSWSTPVAETFIVDSTIRTNGSVTVAQAPIGTNAANMVVNVNGIRLVGPTGIEWIGDGTTNSFGLPQRMGISFLQSNIDAPNEILVWVNDVLQKQSFGAQVGSYGVTDWDGSNTPGRQVVFTTPPDSGDQILIAVTTLANCLFAYNASGPAFTTELQIVPLLNVGDVIEVITWNNTGQQNALTLTFQGPTEIGFIVTQPYDTTDYDSPSVNNPLEVLPGEFDAEIGVSIPTNDFDLLRNISDGNRLWVTLNGMRIFEGNDYTIEGQYLILASGPINSSQQLVVTEFTNSIVPEAAGFRIFQDMRGVQATYRITTTTTTELAQNLTATADIIYVVNANALSEPDLPSGIFGVITIGGERIMYRNRDTVANTVSGLQRGTAGTAAAAHYVGNAVYDIGRGNLLNSEYQNYIVKDTTLGDGTTLIFYAPSINISDFGDSSTDYIESIEVYVGGIRQYNVNQTSAESQYRYFVTDFGPLAIEFDVIAPAAGSEVVILQRRGLSWYQPGATTPSDGIALQETNTTAARFLCDR